MLFNLFGNAINLLSTILRLLNPTLLLLKIHLPLINRYFMHQIHVISVGRPLQIIKHNLCFFYTSITYVYAHKYLKY